MEPQIVMTIGGKQVLVTKVKNYKQHKHNVKPNTSSHQGSLCDPTSNMSKMVAYTPIKIPALKEKSSNPGPLGLNSTKNINVVSVSKPNVVINMQNTANQLKAKLPNLGSLIEPKTLVSTTSQPVSQQKLLKSKQKSLALTSYQPASQQESLASTSFQPGSQQKSLASTSSQPALQQKSLASTTFQPGLQKKSLASTTSQPAPQQKLLKSKQKLLAFTSSQPASQQETLALTSFQPGSQQKSLALTSSQPALQQKSLASTTFQPGSHYLGLNPAKTIDNKSYMKEPNDVARKEYTANQQNLVSSSRIIASFRNQPYSEPYSPASLDYTPIQVHASKENSSNPGLSIEQTSLSSTTLNQQDLSPFLCFNNLATNFTSTGITLQNQQSSPTSFDYTTIQVSAFKENSEHPNNNKFIRIKPTVAMNVNNQLIYENHSNSSENFASTGSSVEKFENQTNSLNIASKETTQNSGPSNKEKSSGSNQQDCLCTLEIYMKEFLNLTAQTFD